MPDAAPRLAELPQRDARETMVAGLDQHLGQQGAGGRLARGKVPSRDLRLAQPRGKLVSDPLELAEIEQPRAVDAAARPRVSFLRCPAHLERADHGPRQLGVEMRDLPAQRDPRGVLPRSAGPLRGDGRRRRGGHRLRDHCQSHSCRQYQGSPVASPSCACQSASCRCTSGTPGTPMANSTSARVRGPGAEPGSGSPSSGAWRRPASATVSDPS